MNKSVLLSAFLSGLVTWIFMYLDAKLFDDPKSKFTYIKGIVYVATVVGVTVYFLTGETMQPRTSLAASQMGGFAIPAAAPAEMLRGLPPF